MAIDWSQYEVKDEDAPQSMIAPTPFNEPPKVDWSRYEATPEDDEELEIPEETGGFGVYHDIQDMFGNALDRGSDFIDQAPDNLSRIKEDVSKNGIRGVGHILGQLHASHADLLKAAVNTPHDFAKYLLRKNLAFNNKPPDIYSLLRDKLGDKVKLPEAPKDFADVVPSIPEDTGVEKALGLEAQPERGDELTRAVPDIAALVQGGRSLFKLGKKVIKGPDLHQAIRDTQKVVNEAEADAGKVFDKVESEVGKRGLDNIPIAPEVINQAKSFLPNTKANKALIDSASTGDYKALRKLQSDLRVKAEKALSSQLKAENDEGELIHETREDINKSIAKHLEDTGHKDLATDLKGARDRYRDIKKTYFSTPALAKVFGASQKVPKNPMTLLSEESTEMKKFMSKHPEVERKLKNALSHKQKKKIAGKALAVALGGVTAGGTYKALSK